MVNNKNLTCGTCGSDASEDSEYCFNCGAIFIEDVKCINHDNIEAAGVCVICSRAFCSECGIDAVGRFFCEEHDEYEVYQNMARIYGSADEVAIRYAAARLEEAGLHPFIFSRKASPMHLGGADYSLFRASGDSANVIINEIKLMVPFSEVVEAEEILSELEIE